jgi:predicted nucleic acid-binding protein
VNYYIDSSAIIKLIIKEEESQALLRVINQKMFTSVLAKVEVGRTLARSGTSITKVRDQVMHHLDFLPISEEVINLIDEIPLPRQVRSLDSIHIGSAHLVSELIDGVITYDKDMQQALTQLGIIWLAPKSSQPN